MLPLSDAYGACPGATEDTTCSGAHSDSNPAASAACTMFLAASGVGNPVLAKTIPHFIANPLAGLVSLTVTCRKSGL
jgi:hypothetical protein